MTFVDPYGANPSPADHLCTPPSRLEPGPQPNSLTDSTEARQWLLVSQALNGAYFSLSPDLIHWTAPKLFFQAQVTWNYKCGDPDPIAYPLLLDSTSSSRNFETVGKTAYLYFTQFHYTNCQRCSTVTSSECRFGSQPADVPSRPPQGDGRPAGGGRRCGPLDRPAFFDYHHGQTGVARNAIQLHPVLASPALPGRNPCSRLGRAAIAKGARSTNTRHVALCSEGDLLECGRQDRKGVP